MQIPALRNGSELFAELRVVEGDISRVEVVVPQEGRVVGSGGDLFEALEHVRLSLEDKGVLLACNGCRRDVYPSPMLRQAVHGRRAYVLEIPRDGRRPPTVDIFEPALDLSAVVTVEEQRQWFERWWMSPVSGTGGPA